MRRILAAVVLAAVTAFAAGCASTPPPVSEKVQKYYDENVVNKPLVAPTADDPLKDKRADGVLSTYFIGDSLTDGWNATAQLKSFRPLVTAALQKGGKVAVSDDFKAGAKLAEVSRLAAVPKNIDLVVLELGTNDVNKTEITNFRADLNALVARLTASDPVLVCLGTWQYGTTQGFDGQIQQACEAEGGRYVKIGDLREDPVMVAKEGTDAYPAMADGAHPNDLGHAEIARRVLARLSL